MSVGGGLEGGSFHLLMVTCGLQVDCVRTVRVSLSGDERKMGPPRSTGWSLSSVGVLARVGQVPECQLGREIRQGIIFRKNILQ